LCLIPARPSIVDIEATAPTLSIIRAWKQAVRFRTQPDADRGQRINHAAATLGDKAALDIADVLAQPFIVMRNDHQDALSAGLAVTEYAPASKSAEEIRGLWQWVETKRNRYRTKPLGDRRTAAGSSANSGIARNHSRDVSAYACENGRGGFTEKGSTTNSRVPDAVQRLFGDAPQKPGPIRSAVK